MNLQAEAFNPSNAPLSDTTLNTLRAAHDPSTIYWGLPQSGKEAQIRGAQAVIDAVGTIYQQDPQFMAKLTSDYPAYGEYLAWKQGQYQHNGTAAGLNTSVDAFLGNLIKPQDARQLQQLASGAGLQGEALQRWLELNGLNGFSDITKRQLPYIKAQLQQMQALNQQPRARQPLP